jgi:hypothetical protein
MRSVVIRLVALSSAGARTRTSARGGRRCGSTRPVLAGQGPRMRRRRTRSRSTPRRRRTGPTCRRSGALPPPRRGPAASAPPLARRRSGREGHDLPRRPVRRRRVRPRPARLVRPARSLAAARGRTGPPQQEGRTGRRVALARPPLAQLPVARPPLARVPVARPPLARVPVARPPLARGPAARGVALPRLAIRRPVALPAPPPPAARQPAVRHLVAGLVVRRQVGRRDAMPQRGSRRRGSTVATQVPGLPSHRLLDRYPICRGSPSLRRRPSRHARAGSHPRCRHRRRGRRQLPRHRSGRGQRRRRHHRPPGYRHPRRGRVGPHPRRLRGRPGRRRAPGVPRRPWSRGRLGRRHVKGARQGGIAGRRSRGRLGRRSGMPRARSARRRRGRRTSRRLAGNQSGGPRWAVGGSRYPDSSGHLRSHGRQANHRAKRPPAAPLRAPSPAAPLPAPSPATPLPASSPVARRPRASPRSPGRRSGRRSGARRSPEGPSPAASEAHGVTAATASCCRRPPASRSQVSAPTRSRARPSC